MCGIAGIFFSRTGRPAERALVQRMCAEITHRGPDDEGIYVDNELGIGMRRLSIIDLAGGHQPVFNEDGTVCVVFNGEIYNFRDLREELVRGGHVLKTNSDTEVLVHLYEEYGAEFPTKLNGMFAIALWDQKRRRLLLVRDRLGVKPLYYAWTADGLVFGSELKCVLEHADLRRDLDRRAIYHYFTLGYIPHPHTIYESVRQLEPAGRLDVCDGRIKVDRYWKLVARVDPDCDKGQAIERLRELLMDAVRIRMISDVPIGAFLSGGIDSSITVALMAQQSRSPIKTFHIAFDNPNDSEREYARAVARQYATDHHEFVVNVTAAGMLDILDRHFDEPFADSSAIPTWYVSKIAREHVTVALAGDGGDESFGGYSRYLTALSRNRVPAGVRKLLRPAGSALGRVIPRFSPAYNTIRNIGMNALQFHANGNHETDTRTLLSHEFLAGLGDVSTRDLLCANQSDADPSDPLSPLALLDIAHYLPDDLLVKVDRMSMAHSLEVRAPFLDYRLVEFAATLPAHLKIQGTNTKVILKEAFGGALPEVVLQQRKRGFSIPLARWLREDLRDLVEDAVSSRELNETGFFDPREIRSIWFEHKLKRRSRAAQLWRLLCFAHWLGQRSGHVDVDSNSRSAAPVCS